MEAVMSRARSWLGPATRATSRRERCNRSIRLKFITYAFEDPDHRKPHTTAMYTAIQLYKLYPDTAVLTWR